MTAQLTYTTRPGLRIANAFPAPTIGDVAEAAGVSKSTASRALCGAPNVHPATRDRVREAATRLSYVPNDAARELAARRAVVVAQLIAKQIAG